MKRILSVCAWAVCLAESAFCLDTGLASNLEVALPTAGTLGLAFSATNNNLGSVFWADPGNDLASYSLVGLGAKYYFDGTLRLSGAADLFFNSWTYTNRDQQSLVGTALQVELDCILLKSGPTDVFVGPTAEIGLVWGSFTSRSNAVKTAIAGQTYALGGVVGADFFPHPQFSIGASCPVLFRFASASTTSASALVGPSETSVFALGSVLIDLTYYL